MRPRQSGSKADHEAAGLPRPDPMRQHQRGVQSTSVVGWIGERGCRSSVNLDNELIHHVHLRLSTYSDRPGKGELPPRSSTY